MVSLDRTSPCRPYPTTMKTRQFNEDFPALLMKIFKITIFWFLIWLHYRMQLNSYIIQNLVEKAQNFFQFSLEQVTEVIVFGERLSKVQIDKFQSFQVPIQQLYLFGTFHCFFSVLFILFFFSTKSPEKVNNECCSN